MSFSYTSASTQTVERSATSKSVIFASTAAPSTIFLSTT